jgi:hypothetical protein
MNRTVKEATVKTFHYETLESLLQNRALSCGTGPLGYGWRV